MMAYWHWQHRTGAQRPGLPVVALLLALAGPCDAQESAPDYDSKQALSVSQAAIDRDLGDWTFTDSSGSPVRLSDYRGRPLLISMIFTSCHHVCPAITRHLDVSVRHARQALGDDSFQVITVGFDTAVDTPEAMRLFAKRQGVDDRNWAFLSGSDKAVGQLAERIGFSWYPSPRGFDHINQVTLVDRDGVVYRQVYGAAFELPALVEPLKELVFNRPRPSEPFTDGLLNRIKLFCTVYDPSSGRYHFDYSLFVGMAVGALILLSVMAWLLTEYLRGQRSRRRSADGA